MHVRVTDTAPARMKLERQPGESVRDFLHREHVARRRRLIAHPAKTSPSKAAPAAKPAVVVVIPAVARPAPAPAASVPSAAAVPVVTKALADFARLNAVNGEPTLGLILRVCCLHFGYSKAGLLSDRRAQPLVRHRQIVAYLAKSLTRHSLPEIGRRLGGRDHTTILHAVKATEQRIETGETTVIYRDGVHVPVAVRDLVRDLKAAIEAAMIEAATCAPATVSAETETTETEQATGKCDGASC